MRHGCRRLCLEDVADLQLEHPRWINGTEPWNCVCRRAHRDQLAKRRIDAASITIRRLRTPEEVAVVEEIESLEPQQQGARPGLHAALEEQRHILGAGA